MAIFLVECNPDGEIFVMKNAGDFIVDCLAEGAYKEEDFFNSFPQEENPQYWKKSCMIISGEFITLNDFLKTVSK